MEKIKDWADDIILHFWHCASSCKDTATTSDDEAVESMKVVILLHTNFTSFTCWQWQSSLELNVIVIYIFLQNSKHIAAQSKCFEVVGRISKVLGSKGQNLCGFSFDITKLTQCEFWVGSRIILPKLPTAGSFLLGWYSLFCFLE